jgi:hypothetical protein
MGTEESMVLKRKIKDPQGYILAGMSFFMIGIFASMIGEGRLIMTFFSNLIPNESLLHTIQGIASGFSIPMLFASIYFNLRSLALRRTR